VKIFILDFLDIDWNSTIEIDKNDVNHSLVDFMKNMNIILDKYMPSKKVSQKEFKRKFKPWISDNILKKIEYKNSIFKKYIKCKNTENKSGLYDNFKLLKNEVTSLTRESKKEYYKTYFSNNKKNLKNIWKGIKEIIDIKCKNFDHPTCITHDNKTITNPIEIGNCFNRYFTSIADDSLNKRKYEGIK
jgi:carboxypeptidase C (cathepsin A)